MSYQQQKMISSSLVTTDDAFPLLNSTTRKKSFGYKSIEVKASSTDVVAVAEDDDDDQSMSDEDDQHKTSVAQTFVHLLKGYMGAGCLSLPWAVSQLGLFWGPLAIFVIAYWSSYNCWTIVKLKRFIERETTYIDDKASEASSVTTNTQVTYAAVGEFFYGTKFETYVALCVCIQQLAICTVFISFVGENILAVMQQNNITFMATHTGVMTLELPLILGLCLIPNLKMLTPVMTAGTVLLGVTFVAVGVIIQKEWDNRPMEPIELDLANAPLAICAILYSYEGINLILPVESVMLEPQYFKLPFISAMLSVAGILASFAVICVVTFGYVTNGSMTAFLIEAYPDDPEIAWWLMVANSAVSLSVLFTYPLQLFPALELLAPSFSKFLSQEEKDDLDDDDDLSAFEPLPPLPEHDIPEVEEWDEHQYDELGGGGGGGGGGIQEDDDEDAGTKDGAENTSVAYSAMTSIQSILPEMTMPGDSPLLRVLLVLTTYFVAVIVPNVQALISLAGALAGSSTALLIPPMLELAWIKHLESDETTTPTIPTSADFDPSNGMAASSATAPNPIRQQKDVESRWTTVSPGTEHCGLGKWWFEKVKCHILLLFGFLFFCIGTYASMADIVRIYLE